MADDDLGNLERAVLLTLMAEAGTASNPELKEMLGDTLTGKPRRMLNERGLVTSEMDGRAFRHSLTESGWHWCAEEMSKPRPGRPGPLGAALYRVLPAVDRGLDRLDTSPAEFFCISTGDEGPASGSDASPDLESRIREAYRKLSNAPNEWVSLTALRAHLGDVAKPDVDAVLRRMEHQRGVNIVPEVNQKVLSEEDRRAAVRIGGEDKHLLAIEDR